MSYVALGAKRRRSKSKSRKSASKKKMRLNPAAKAEVKAMIEKKMDLAIEDKFLLDQNYINNKAAWTDDYHVAAIDLSPTINRGTSSNERTGQKVTLKQFHVWFQLMGPIANTLYRVDYATDLLKDNYPEANTQPFAKYEPITLYMVRVPITVWNAYSAADKRNILATRFPIKGEYPQDRAESTLLEAAKQIKLLKQKTFKLPYDYHNVLFNTNTGIPMNQAISMPKPLNFKMSMDINQKIFMNDTTMNPRDYGYIAYLCGKTNLLLGGWGDYASLEVLNTRVLWTYEDA